MSFFDLATGLFSWIKNSIVSFFDSLQQKNKQQESIAIMTVTSEGQDTEHSVVPILQDEVARQNRSALSRIQELIAECCQQVDQQKYDIQELLNECALRKQEECSLRHQIDSIKREIIQVKDEHREIRELIEREQQSIAELRESNTEIRGCLTTLEKDYAELAADSRAMHRQMREITMSQQALQNEMQELRKAGDRFLETIRETEAFLFQIKTHCDRVVGAVLPQHMKGFSSRARTTYGMLYRLHQAFLSMPIPTLVDNTEQDERLRRHNAHETLHSFECPITKQIMQDPVRAEDGHCYERSALAGWYARWNRTSPLNPAVTLSTPPALLPTAEDVRAQIQALDHQSSTPRCD
jgi:prefoldin subunit 5